MIPTLYAHIQKSAYIQITSCPSQSGPMNISPCRSSCVWIKPLNPKDHLIIINGFYAQVKANKTVYLFILFIINIINKLWGY